MYTKFKIKVWLTKKCIFENNEIMLIYPWINFFCYIYMCHAEASFIVNQTNDNEIQYVEHHKLLFTESVIGDSITHVVQVAFVTVKEVVQPVSCYTGC